MKIHLLPLFAVLIISCGGEPEKPKGMPSWSTSYPAVAPGAVTADLNLQADKSSSVYWIITNKAMGFSPDDVKAQAAAPTDAAVKFHGTTTIDTNVPKTETVSGLTQNTKYFAYMVAENTTDKILQTEVKGVNFTTYYRQDTSKTNTYHSTAENREVRYLIYRPEEVLKHPEKKFPILFFLGGNGEVATAAKPMNYYNGNRTLPEYIGKGTDGKGNDVPLMVFTIQHTVKDWNTTLIDEGVTFALGKFNVDVSKVYMSGCSGGGYGCWNYSVAHADRLAAIIPISGGGNTGKACTLKNMPVWAFHNAIDNTVSPTNSQNMIDAVKACPNTKEVMLTYFVDIDAKAHHDCWRRVFNPNDKDWSKTPSMDKPDVYTWLLQFSK